jgi:hypothetical protein
VVPRWTYTRTKLETADRAKEHLKHTAFSSTRRRYCNNLCPANCYAGRFHPFSPCECELSLTFGTQDHTW